MSDNPSSASNGDIEDRIDQIGKYSRFAKAGLGVIVGAFFLALAGLLPSNTGSVPQAVNAILLPTIFIGMGLLLFSIGMHLHLMHLNLVRQLRMSDNQNSQAENPDSKQ